MAAAVILVAARRRCSGRQKMDEAAVQLRAHFSRLTDEELLRVVTTDRAEYRRAALDLAAAELARRRVPVPVAPPAPPSAEDDTEPPKRAFFTRERLAGEGMSLLFILGAWAAGYVVNALLKPGSVVLTVLLYISAAVIFSAILRAAWKECFPESYEWARAEVLREEEEVEAEKLKGELRGAAENALDELGLDWEVGDVYHDSYGYHVDFYDSNDRLRSLVFERPPGAGAGWLAQELARRLRGLPAEPEPERLPFPASQTLE